MTEECKHKPTDRTGLYIMVFLILMNTCSMENKISKLERKLMEGEETKQENIELSKSLKEYLNRLDSFAKEKGLIP